MVQPSNFSWKVALDIATSLAMIIAAVIVAWFQFNPRTRTVPTQTLNVPKQLVSIEGATLKGSTKAAAVLIMYSDFQCPFCRRFAQDVLPQVEREYVSSGKVLLVFKHFPLPIHNLAAKAAVAVECAGRQGRFWEMHDHVFGAASLDDSGLTTLASSLGLRATEFGACTQDKVVLTKVMQDVEVGKGLGVAATPSFFFGKKLSNSEVKVERAFSGTKAILDFRAAIDPLLR